MREEMLKRLEISRGQMLEMLGKAHRAHGPDFVRPVIYPMLFSLIDCFEEYGSDPLEVADVLVEVSGHIKKLVERSREEGPRA